MPCLIGIEMFISAMFPGRHRWIADAIDDGLRLFAIVETVKTGWIFRRRATFVRTRIVVLHDGR